MTRKEIRRKVEENKQDEEPFRMIATQVYIFLFGICFGWAILYFSKFWWLPILDLVLLIVARKLIHKIDERESRRRDWKSK